MPFFRTLLSTGVLLLLFLLIPKAGTGQNEKPKLRTESFPCGAKEFKVDPTLGTIPPAHYLCDNDPVHWNGNGHKFKVTFTGTCPFNEGCDDITDTSAKPTRTEKHMDHFTVIKFSIQVDGGNAIDPYVVGGGGHGVGGGATSPKKNN